MENNKQSPPAGEKGELAIGAEVLLYMNGRRMKKQILESTRNGLLLASLDENPERPPFFQPACLVQDRMDQRILFQLLRFEEGAGRGLQRQDRFRLGPGGPLYIWPEMYRLAMHHWSSLQVFDPYQPDKVLLDDQGLLFNLSETEAGIIVGKPLPRGAFAQCSLPLSETPVMVSAVLTRCEDLHDGTGYRARFMIIDPSLRPRLRDFLLDEQAGRLLAASVR